MYSCPLHNWGSDESPCPECMKGTTGIDLVKLQKEIDDLFAGETTESLLAWLKQQKQSAPASPRTKEEILDAAILKMISDHPDEGYLSLEETKSEPEYKMALSAMDIYVQPFIETVQLSAKSVEIMKGEIDRLRGLVVS